MESNSSVIASVSHLFPRVFAVRPRDLGISFDLQYQQNHPSQQDCCQALAIRPFIQHKLSFMLLSPAIKITSTKRTTSTWLIVLIQESLKFQSDAFKHAVLHRDILFFLHLIYSREIYICVDAVEDESLRRPWMSKQDTRDSTEQDERFVFTRVFKVQKIIKLETDF